MPEHYVRDHERLVMGGVWSQVYMRFEYDEESRGKNPFWIDQLTPIQIATFDLEEYRRVRGEFTTGEWLGLIMRSMGYEPDEMSRRLKLLFLVRRDDMAFIDRMHFYVPGWEIPKMRNDLFTNHYGFVVDYLAEALREMRKHNFTEVIDRHFSLGAHLNARDRKAVRKSVSGLMKILFPHGEVTQEELAGGVAGAMKESVQRAFSFLQAKKSELGIARDLDVSADIMEHVDPIFFGDAKTAAMKVLGGP